MYYSKIRRSEKRGRGKNTNIVAQIPDKHCVRGEIYLANLELVVGSEQGGIHPVVILQNNVGNKHSPTTIAAPITTKRVPNSLPIHVFVFATRSGLPQDSCVLMEQIRLLDKSRLTEKIGKVNAITMDYIDTALKISVGLNSKYN